MYVSSIHICKTEVGLYYRYSGVVCPFNQVWGISIRWRYITNPKISIKMPYCEQTDQHHLVTKNISLTTEVSRPVYMTVDTPYDIIKSLPLPRDLARSVYTTVV